MNTNSSGTNKSFKSALLLVLLHLCGITQGQSYGTTNGYYDSQARVRSYPNIAPQIVSPDQTFRSELGDRLVLPCQVANLDKFVLMWKQGNRLLTAGKMVVRKDSRIRLRDDFSLEIEELRAEDQDTYTCEIDVLGKPISIQHHVEVLVPPAVQAMPRDGIVSTRKGDDVTLRCSGRGNPNPRITWTKKSGTLPSRKPSQEGLSLVLEDVDRGHGGVYVCTATNGVGRPAMAEINVQVKYPPEIEIEQNWYQREGKIEVELNCNVYARPEAEVFWYRRQKKLHETDRQLFQSKPNRVTLHIRQVNPSDFGNYSCRAENSLGKARTYTSLSGHPRPPRFTSDAIGYRAHSYNITWTTDSFSPITEYKLLYRRSDGLPIEQKGHIDEHSGLWEMVAIPVLDPAQTFSTYASYTLKNLHPGAVYDVIAKAKNEFGWSEWSKTFNCFNKGVDYSTQQLADRGSDFLVNEALDLTEKHHRDASPPLVGPDMAFSNAGSISAKNGCLIHSSHLLFGVLLALFYVLKVDCLCMSLH